MSDDAKAFLGVLICMALCVAIGAALLWGAG
jgi:hypothetical protein